MAERFVDRRQVDRREVDRRDVAAAIGGQQAIGQSPPVVRMELRLPLAGASEERIIRQLQELADQPIAGQRPILILEFVAARPSDPGKRSDQATRAVGSGTNFERALRIARWLSGPDGVRVKSIAYCQKTGCGARRPDRLGM